MAENTVTRTLKGVDELKREVANWEHRLESIKSDIESLKKAKESLEKDLLDKRTLFTQEMETRVIDMRRRETTLREAEAKLTEGKQELAKAISLLQADKAATAKAQDLALAKQATYDESKSKLERLILLIKRESEGL